MPLRLKPEKESKPIGARRWFFLKIAGLTAILIVAMQWPGHYYLYHAYTAPGPLTHSETVLIPPGSSKASIAKLLQDHGVIRHRVIFLIAERWFADDRALYAGEYEFPPAASLQEIIKRIRSHQILLHRITIPEGWTSSQAVALIDAAPSMSGHLAADTITEGVLMPDTYFFAYGDDRAALVQRMIRAETTWLAAAWPMRDKTCPLETPEQAVTLAAIVERETAIDTERGLIAGVFCNRLKQHMKLQSDPTVRYALARHTGQGAAFDDRPLTHADLEVADAYNTYQHSGLPPGPIANPGHAALTAVLHPTPTDALYFVADGSGGHRFAATLTEHNRNVAAWLGYRRDRH